MKPYIEVADETQQKEMSKWNAGSNKDAMLKNLESISEDKLKAVLQEHGISTLAGLLRSEVAINANIAIMRAFVAMRRFLSANAVA